MRAPFPSSRWPDAQVVQTGSVPGTEQSSLCAADDFGSVLKVSLIFVLLYFQYRRIGLEAEVTLKDKVSSNLKK